jgi:hypothetical protein
MEPPKLGDPSTMASHPPTAVSPGLGALADEGQRAASHGGALGLATPGALGLPMSGAQGRTPRSQGEDMAATPDVEAA